MSGFDTDPFLIWAIRWTVYVLIGLITALIVQLMYAVVKGDLYLPDILTGPSGRLSYKKIGGAMMIGAVTIAVMRDAADGTLSWELAAVALAGAGLIDLGGGLIDVLQRKFNGGADGKDPVKNARAGRVDPPYGG